MTNRKAVKILLGFLGKYKKHIIIILICLIMITGLNFSIPILNREIMDEGFIGGNKTLLALLAALIFVIHGCSSLIDIITEQSRIQISSQIQIDLFQKAFVHLMKLKVEFFNTSNNTEIFNKLSMDVRTMASIADENIFRIITRVFSMFGGVIGLFIIDFKLTIVVLLFIPIKFLIMKYFAKRKKKIINESMQVCQEQARWFGDTVDGIKEIKLFNIIEYKCNEFALKQKNVIEKLKEMNMLGRLNICTDIVLVQLLIVIIYILGSTQVFDGAMSIGSIFAFITYSSYVTGPITSILSMGYLMAGVIPSTKRYFEFMSLSEEEDIALHQEEKVHFQQLVLKDVIFSYDNGKEILSNVNIEIKKESKTAIIGKNGAGKSTIINLITRMYDPVAGEIFLNGYKINNYSLYTYRNLFSIVNQQIYLFNDTIRNNLCLYKTVDDVIINDAIRDSGLNELIEEVTLDYVVGINGGMLSGGQKQKIALARALIHNKQIIIFDEANSSADASAELYINNLIKGRLADKTVIVITHRQGILECMDNIVHVENGKLIKTNI